MCRSGSTAALGDMDSPKLVEAQCRSLHGSQLQIRSLSALIQGPLHRELLNLNLVLSLLT